MAVSMGKEKGDFVFIFSSEEEDELEVENEEDDYDYEVNSYFSSSEEKEEEEDRKEPNDDNRTKNEESLYKRIIAVLKDGGELGSLTLKHFRAYLRKHGLRVTGSKAVCQQRILDHWNEDETEEEGEEDEKESDDDNRTENDESLYNRLIALLKDGGELGSLRLKHFRAYLRKHGLRMTGSKAVCQQRILEHWKIKDGTAETLYPLSSFYINCTGDVCKGDVVLFEQKVYEKFDQVTRHGKILGKRTIAGRVVKESYGKAKQQHTFTVEVLWSKGVKTLPPLFPLLVKGRNLYKLKTYRQCWSDEAERRNILAEKHKRGNAARLMKDMRKKCTIDVDVEYRCFVGGLAWATDDRALENAFSQFGEILELKIIKDRETGRSKGFGFVTFRDEKSLRDAIESMNGKNLDGRNITVNEAQSRKSGGGVADGIGGGNNGYNRGGGGYVDHRDRGYGGGRREGGYGNDGGYGGGEYDRRDGGHGDGGSCHSRGGKFGGGNDGYNHDGGGGYGDHCEGGYGGGRREGGYGNGRVYGGGRYDRREGGYGDGGFCYSRSDRFGGGYGRYNRSDGVDYGSHREGDYGNSGRYGGDDYNQREESYGNGGSPYSKRNGFGHGNSRYNRIDGGRYGGHYEGGYRGGRCEGRYVGGGYYRREGGYGDDGSRYSRGGRASYGN